MGYLPYKSNICQFIYHTIALGSWSNFFSGWSESCIAKCRCRFRTRGCSMGISPLLKIMWYTDIFGLIVIERSDKLFFLHFSWMHWYIRDWIKFLTYSIGKNAYYKKNNKNKAIFGNFVVDKLKSGFWKNFSIILLPYLKCIFRKLKFVYSGQFNWHTVVWRAFLLIIQNGAGKNVSRNFCLRQKTECFLVQFSYTLSMNFSNKKNSAKFQMYILYIYIIWNRRRKRSFPACGAAVKLHFIVPRRAAEKPPERVPPLDPGEGHRPPDLPPAPSSAGPHTLLSAT